MGSKRGDKLPLAKLENFTTNNLSVKLADFKESIPAHPFDFLYLDPPYYEAKGLYVGHDSFDHDSLASLLKSRDNWLLSYDDCPYVRETYKDYYFETPQWSYAMGSQQAKSNELLISPNPFATP